MSHFLKFNLPTTNTQTQPTWNIATTPPPSVKRKRNVQAPEKIVQQESSPSVKLSSFKFRVPLSNLSAQHKVQKDSTEDIQEDIDILSSSLAEDSEDHLEDRTLKVPQKHSRDGTIIAEGSINETLPSFLRTPSPRPSLVSSPRFIISTKKSPSPSVTPLRWANAMKRPIINHETNSLERSENKKSKYIKGGLAEQLLNLVALEKSERAVWAHGIRRSSLKIPTPSSESSSSTFSPSSSLSSFSTSYPVFYKIISKTLFSRTVYTEATKVESALAIIPEPLIEIVAFSSVFSTFDINETDKVLPGKVVCAWGGIDLEGVRVITKFRVLED